MQSNRRAAPTDLTAGRAAEQYEAAFWQKWRTQVRLVLQKPWLAAGWLQQSRALFQRFNRIYSYLCQQPRPVRRRLHRQVGTTLAGAALALALANAPAQAADFTANDQPTLVAAINNANDETTNPGADTITLTDNITLTTIVDTGGGSFNWGLPIISSTVTIEGAGFTIARDPSVDEFSILTIAPTGTLTLNDATIRGGAGAVGAILNANGVLTVNDSTFTGNAGAMGGAITSKYGTTTINRSTFNNNVAKYGGALFLATPSGFDASTTIVDSTITNNISIGGGGGILAAQSLTITNTVITQNAVKYGNGGGIANGSPTLPGSAITITGSSITNNVVTGSECAGGFGGGIYNMDGAITLTDSTISGNNSGFSGGGLFNYTAAADVASAAKSCTPGDVAAKLKGRGIDAAQLQAWAAATARLMARPAATASQALPTEGATMTLVNSTVSNNIAGSNTSTGRIDLDDGGGILNAGGYVTLTNSTVSGNQALNNADGFYGVGGGIYNTYGGTLTLNNSTLTGNRAGAGGGAIYNHATGSMTLTRTIVSGNTAPACAEIDNSGKYTADAFNLFGHKSLTNASAFTCDSNHFAPGASDITATSDGAMPTALNRILNTTLADNGGATKSHLLVGNSPALNAAGDSSLATDQRGTARPQGAADDIGAIEMPVATITIALDAQPNVSTNLGFFGSLGSFALDDSNSDDGDAYTNTRTFSVVPGVYTVRRNNSGGWFTTDITCTAGSNATTNLAQRSTTLTMAADEAVTCTFTVERAVQITARAFHDIVRNNANLGRRNAGDPWLANWPMSVSASPTNTVASGQTSATAIDGLYQINFAYLRPGDYTVCTVLPDGSWTPTSPTALEPNFAKYCKTVTVAPGQKATVLFGAYQASVAARISLTPEAELVTDKDNIITLPYDRAEDETGTEEDGLLRSFLPLIKR